MMKKFILILVVCFLGIYSWAQLPMGFNYQAVVRNAAGDLLNDQDIGFRFSILQGSATGNAIYTETQTVTSNGYGICNLKIGEGDVAIGNISTMDWSTGAYFLKIEIDQNGGTSYSHIGTSELLSVPYSLYANKANQAANIENEVLYFTDSDTLFAVKDRNGNIVFAVFPDGAKVYINEQVKGNVGGFAVSGRSPTKSVEYDMFNITPDSARIYVNQAVKGSVGGFAVSGRSPGKATTIQFLNLTSDNYFIGHDVASNITTGLRNSVIGYNAGYSLGGGSDNVFIGNKAGYSTGAGSVGGNENVFIGNEAGYKSTGPVRNVFIGHEAGHENVSGQYNLYVGNGAGRNGTGQYNTVLGGLAANTYDFGNSNVVIGYVAGRDMVSAQNVYVGQAAGYNNAGTVGGNVFIGYYAGETLQNQDHRLAIANNRSTSPLIYGEFDNQRVVINGTTTNGYTFYVNGSASGSSAWANTSDFRLKKEIQTIPNALDKVLGLRGVNFKWKDESKLGGEIQMGFIAQEAEKIIPEVVQQNNDTYTMQYAPVTALLVEAVKEQQKEIEDLKNENKELRVRLFEIEELLKKK